MLARHTCVRPETGSRRGTTGHSHRAWRSRCGGREQERGFIALRSIAARRRCARVHRIDHRRSRRFAGRASSIYGWLQRRFSTGERRHRARARICRADVYRAHRRSGREQRVPATCASPTLRVSLCARVVLMVAGRRSQVSGASAFTRDTQLNASAPGTGDQRPQAGRGRAITANALARTRSRRAGGSRTSTLAPSRDDIVAAIVADDARGNDLNEPAGKHQVMKLLSRITKRPVIYIDEATNIARHSMRRLGMPASLIEGLLQHRVFA